MKNLSEYPYSVTTAVFLIILLFGVYFLYWGEEHIAFLTLTYFIVTLGIKLDDISKQIGTGYVKLSEDEKHVEMQLNEIKTSLASIDNTLKHILTTIDQNNEKKEDNNEYDEDETSMDLPFS